MNKKHVPQKKFTVGLTGGIGSGKTAVSSRFAKHGIDIIDTDVIAHGLTTAQGQAIPAVRHAFGPQALTFDGALARDWMRQYIFDAPQARQTLENILHPMIHRQSQVCLAQAAQTSSPYCLLVVPLLAENPTWHDILDCIVVIDCTCQTQIRRVMQRSQLSHTQVQKIIDSQASRAARRAIADHIIDNDSDNLTLLHRQVDALHQQWIDLIKGELHHPPG